MPTDTATLNLSGTRRLPVVQQIEAAECGLACLAMMAGWYGYDVDLLTLRRRFGVSLNGMTLRQLMDIAARIGLSARAVRCELSELGALRLPCILHWNLNHFVVLRKVRGNRAWIHDPAVGSRLLQLSEISAAFTGVALELVPVDGFEKKRERQTLRMSHLWKWQPETRSALLRAIVLSLILELFVLLMPYYMQLVVDQAILKADTDLLTVLACAFVLVTVFNAGAATLRALVVQYLANVVSYDMAARLLHHLLALPLDFFQKRRLGDLLQRFRSIEPIRQFIVTGGITTLIDGLLAGVTFALMLLYSKKLALLSFGVVSFYAGLRYIVRTVARSYAMDAMVTDAREQSQFLETIRAIQTIKVNGGERARETEWLNLCVGKLNAVIRVGNLGIAYQAATSVLAGISDVAIIYIAAKDVMAGRSTIGVLTAFLAYKNQFMSRLMSLADQLIQYRMLDVQLNRVADIALAAAEASPTGAESLDWDLQGAFALQDLVFRYSSLEKAVLVGATLRIRAGEFVAIVGASGEGKSTLLKVMMGLYTCESGEVLVDCRSIKELDASALRRRIGVVMQEDQLLTGTLGENIALFDDPPDMEQVRKCGRQAQIDEEIMALPMQYHTLVSDLGTSLSAGQRQRVLLARALYRAPKALFLDECTVHVGPDCEQRIVEMLKKLSATRVVVTHSTVMARAADRVFRLQHGKLVSAGGIDSPPWGTVTDSWLVEDVKGVDRAVEEGEV